MWVFGHCTWVSRAQMDPWWMPCPTLNLPIVAPTSFILDWRDSSVSRVLPGLCSPFLTGLLIMWHEPEGYFFSSLTDVLFQVLGKSLPFITLFLFWLKLRSFWFRPDEVIAHSRGYCTVTIYSEPCLLSGHVGLRVAAISYMILLTLCLHLHL